MKTVRQAIARVIAEELEGGADARQLAESLAQYLVQERRVNELDAIMREVAAVRARDYGIVEAAVTTAEPLNEALAAQTQDLIARYSGHPKTIIVDATVDPQLLGGVKIATGDYELDATVSAKLAQLQQPILKGAS